MLTAPDARTSHFSFSLNYEITFLHRIFSPGFCLTLKSFLEVTRENLARYACWKQETIPSRSLFFSVPSKVCVKSGQFFFKVFFLGGS